MAQRRYMLTTTKMEEWFREFNEKYFKNSLSTPSFAIMNTKTKSGDYNYTKKQIRLSIYRDRNEHGFQNTFIHEMIHHWQYETGQEDIKNRKPHGECFKRMAESINRDGWNIQRCSTDYSLPIRVKKPRRQGKWKNLAIWENELGTKEWLMPQ